MSALLRRFDLTRDFRKYREATRLVWNTFLSGCADQEDTFPEIDDALFHAILESRINLDLKRTEGDAAHYPNLEVRSPDKSALFLSESTEFNSWIDKKLSKNSKLRYAKLFDFDSVSGASRDFEYLKCVAIDDGAASAPQRNVLLVHARGARILFVESE